MNLPDRHQTDRLDRLMRSTLSFALYRLPETDECRLVLQTSDKPEHLESLRQLTGKKGFVMAPFRLSEAHPMVLVRPDVTANGWTDIDKAVTTFVPPSILSDTHEARQEDSSLSVFSKESEKSRYNKIFNCFISFLQRGTFQKLVLSRSTNQPVRDDFSPVDAFLYACKSYPRMMAYLCHTPATGTWTGCSPEVLLSGQGQDWHTMALAGTLPMEGETVPMKWDGKNREEQRCVAEYVRDTLRTCSRTMMEEGPYPVRAGRLAHLRTDFRFTPANNVGTGDLLQALHPTPAVCGLPKAEAYRFIAEHEGYERSYYSGFVGRLDTDSPTDLYVNLRCMEIKPGRAVLYAGGGILPSSEAEAEWEETEKKMDTMRSVIAGAHI